ncbi:MAG: 5-oxoprolinase subunit PxpB [Burkholderiales bacterium]|nr:5-oxoprolinase subunit PxpB [Burkholderiales bacterium]
MNARRRAAAAAAAHRMLQAGDQALVVEFGDAIDAHLNRLVQVLDRRVAEASIRGVIECVPTYRSLMIVYDPLRIQSAALRRRIARLVPKSAEAEAPARRWTIPVAYGGAHGLDLEEVARAHGLTRDEVIALHSGAEYRVYMIGFSPGLAYLGGLPEALHTPRRTSPRLRVPAGSVSIGGVQAAVFSVEIPSGWHLLGRTPERMFDLRRAQPFLLGAGDRVRFRPIPAAEYDRLAAIAGRGEQVAECEAPA